MRRRRSSPTSSPRSISRTSTSICGGVRMTRYAVRHATVYEYGGDVAHSHHLLHLKPRNFEYQRCLRILSRSTRSRVRRARIVDAFGNAHRAPRIRPPARPSVRHRGDAGRGSAPPGRALEDCESWETVRERLSYHASPMRRPISTPAASGCSSSHVRIKQALEDYAKDCFAAGRPIAAAAEALMRKIHREFDYVPGLDQQPHLDRRSPREPPRRLPGLRASHDRVPALLRSRRPLRERIYQNHPHGEADVAGRRRCLPCLGIGLLPAARLGRFRSDQRLPGRRGSRHARLGPRFRRRVSASRHDRRRWPAQAERGCGGAAAGSRGFLQSATRAPDRMLVYQRATCAGAAINPMSATVRLTESSSCTGGLLDADSPQHPEVTP